jgi:DMSO reductase family type II enzyme heme b subunit
MGSPQAPVNAWYWRADAESPLSVTATGLGSTVRHGNGSLRAAASYESAGWRVVISRPLVVHEDGVVQLRSGWQRKVGFAVWQGSNAERGGLKAVTLDWEPLEIEA